MRSLMTVVLGMLLVTAGSCVYAQAQPGKPKANSAPVVGAGQAVKTVAPAPAKATQHKLAKTASTTSAPGTAAATAEAGKAVRRDPFESLVGRQKADADAAKNLPPGKAGLQVSTLRLDGIVRSANGMIAVVSNPQARTYFLREGDQLYDGRVEKIAMDGVSFHETGKDAFGKPVERQVNKRIYSSAGEQQ
ncbi:MAG: hypothetical protein NVS9B4_22730 [Candidatus Acidiferrum sp.]